MCTSYPIAKRQVIGHSGAHIITILIIIASSSDACYYYEHIMLYPRHPIQKQLINLKCSESARYCVSASGHGRGQVRQDLRHLLLAGVPAPFGGPSCSLRAWAGSSSTRSTAFTSRRSSCVVACPNRLCDHDIVDCRGMACSLLALDIGNGQGMGEVGFGKICGSASRRSSRAFRWPVLQRQGMGEVEFGKIYGIYFSPEFLRHRLPGPALRPWHRRLPRRGVLRAGPERR